MMRKRCLAQVLCCLAFAAVAQAVNVDMDPVPRIPLRPGESQHFLVHLYRFGEHSLVQVCEGDEIHDRERQGIQGKGMQG